MSGPLRGLADWALGGIGAAGHGNNNADDDGEEEEAQEQQQPSPPQDAGPALTAEEMRAQRLARMEELQRRQQQEKQEQQEQQLAAAQQAAAAAADGGPEPMDVEPPSFNNNGGGGGGGAAYEKSKPAPTTASKPKPQPPAPVEATPSPPAANKPATTATATTTKSPRKETNDARKLQRKKEQLLKKVLGVALVGSSGSSSSPIGSAMTTSDGSRVVVLDLGGDPEISVERVAEILATRISTMPGTGIMSSGGGGSGGGGGGAQNNKPLLAYLGSCHKRAGEELKSPPCSKSDDLASLAAEIQQQVVSYAASCLVDPDLFEAGRDSPAQLAQCLLAGMTDVAASITIGVGSGTASSFYHKLVEEILNQHGQSDLIPIVQQVVDSFATKLGRIDSVLDSGADGADGMMLISALAALCSHRKVAEVVTGLPSFLLPAVGTPAANELVRPPPPPGANANVLFGMFTSLPYRKRSGPGLEKQTVLGACLRLGIPNPKTTPNPGFPATSILHQSVDSIDRTTSAQRNQLRLCQEATYQFVLALVKGGQVPKTNVLQWFQDALVVNEKAGGMQPDTNKVSSPNLLLNLSMVLLRLCEPVTNDDKKIPLVDPGFVSSPSDHGGVFATAGDDAVTRLGGEGEDSIGTRTDYNPKNGFISTIFFYCARAMHFGLVPALQLHDRLLRTISFLHREMTSRGPVRDPRVEQSLASHIARRYSYEVFLHQPELVAETCRFGTYLCHVLLDELDADLKTMPEDFVADTVELFMNLPKKSLRDVELRYLFELVVKLLSAKYAGMVRNYNLRAMLGDVLYDLFLPPPPGERSHVPASVWTDPLAGGQPYLLSSPAAQESLAPSLLLLYGEVEQTGYYEKMSHRAKISKLLKYLWESPEHRHAFKLITEKEESFISFANGIMNETNQLITNIMQKLPEIREAQEKMKNVEEWGRTSQEEQERITSRLSDNENEVKHALPLCNQILEMFRYLNTDADIRELFLCDELCSRLNDMLLHVLKKLVGSKGLELKVDNPDEYEFKPKEMLMNLCAIYGLFASSVPFQEECAKSATYDAALLRSAVKTCRRINALKGETLKAFEALPEAVEAAHERSAADEKLKDDAPEEFMCALLSTYMDNPMKLPSGNMVDRKNILRHLLNKKEDPFNRDPLTKADLQPATELKERMDAWLQTKRDEARMEMET